MLDQIAETGEKEHAFIALLGVLGRLDAGEGGVVKKAVEDHGKGFEVRSLKLKLLDDGTDFWTHGTAPFWGICVDPKTGA